MDERITSPPPSRLRQDAEQLIRNRPDTGQDAPEWTEAELALHLSDPEQLMAQLLQQRHELQVHQIELELQNESLAQANLDLEQARRQYADLF